MHKTPLRAIAAIAAAAVVCSSSPAARADGMENVYEQTVVPGANSAIYNAMEAQRKEREAKASVARRQATQVAPGQKVAPGTVAQAPPVSQQPVSQSVGFPLGLEYTADFSVAYPFGNIGTYGRTWLYGGGDISLGYAFNPTTRVVASMFQLQHWPYGFNSGLAPDGNKGKVAGSF